MAEHIILFVEGDTDEVLFKKIIARYKELANYESNIICHIDNFNSSLNFPGPKRPWQ